MNELSFAAVDSLESGIIRITPNEGVEICAEDIGEVESMIQPVAPARLLVDRINSYSYSFEAIQAIRVCEGVLAVAILVHGYSSQVTAQFVRGNAGDSRYPMEIFSDEADAIRWVLLQ